MTFWKTTRASISGGQQQRVSLARALVRDADLYLLDEPMGQLEPQLRAVLRGRIKSLLAEREMTAIFVTHDQTEASALADRIAVMEDGVLQQFASEKELKERPTNLFVASFIGEPPMNVLEMEVKQADGSFRLSAGPDVAFEISGDGLDQAARGAACVGTPRAGRNPAAEDSGWGRSRARTHRLQSMAGRSVAYRRRMRRSSPDRCYSQQDRGPSWRRGPVRDCAAAPAHFRPRRGLHSPCGAVLTMPRDVIVGIDAGTSLIKTVAFTRDGRQLGDFSLPNSYSTLAGGRVEQDMSRTWDDTVAALRGLAAAVPDLGPRLGGGGGHRAGRWYLADR